MNGDTSDYAFPLPETAIGQVVAQFGQTGMTLRDYYAGQALVGYLNGTIDSDSIPRPSLAAELSFDYAEAMIAERNHRRGN